LNGEVCPVANEARNGGGKVERKIRRMVAALIKGDPPDSPWVQSARDLMTSLLILVNPKGEFGKIPSRRKGNGQSKRKEA
jgi:hypothetical protein